MSLLRLRQFAEGEGRYRVVAEFENGGVRRSAESRFELQFTAQDQEDIRWYLEDFLQYPMDPDRKSTRLNSSHLVISYAVFCLKKEADCLRRPGWFGLLPQPPSVDDRRVLAAWAIEWAPAG